MICTIVGYPLVRVRLEFSGFWYFSSLQHDRTPGEVRHGVHAYEQRIICSPWKYICQLHLFGAYPSRRSSGRRVASFLYCSLVFDCFRALDALPWGRCRALLPAIHNECNHDFRTRDRSRNSRGCGISPSAHFLPCPARYIHRYNYDQDRVAFFYSASCVVGGWRHGNILGSSSFSPSD